MHLSQIYMEDEDDGEDIDINKYKTFNWTLFVLHSCTQIAETIGELFGGGRGLSQVISSGVLLLDRWLVFV